MMRRDGMALAAIALIGTAFISPGVLAQRPDASSRAVGQPYGAYWLGGVRHPRNDVDPWQRRGGGIVALQGHRADKLAGRRDILEGQYHGLAPRPIHGSTSPYGQGYGNYSFHYQYGIAPEHYAPYPAQCFGVEEMEGSRFGPTMEGEGVMPQFYWPPSLGPSPLAPPPQPPATLFVLLAKPAPQVEPVNPLLAGEPWDLLRAGDAAKAEHLFAILALRAAESSLPRLGFAMCAALQENDAKALRIMRRALETDAAALRLVLEDDALSARARDLADRYAEKEDSEAQFLAAAFFYVLEEPGRAEAALALAETSEDLAAGVTKIRGLLTQAAPNSAPQAVAELAVNAP